MGTPISVQARDSVEAALQYEMGRGFVTGSKLFFALDVPRARASSAALDERKKQDGQKIERHVPQVSAWDSHNSLPQIKSIALNTLWGSANTISYIFGPASPIRSVTMRASASKRQ